MKTHHITAILLSAILLLCLPAVTRAENDVILDAMTDELNRSMKSLQIENMEKPYYLEYSITDKKQISIQAVFGSLTGSSKSHNRSLRVDLRVGDYSLDNTKFMGSRSMFGGRVRTTGRLVKENDYDAIRRDIWLVTDRVYKSVLEQLAAKKAFIKNQAQTEDIPDFSKEKSVKEIEPPVTMKVDREKWETIVKNLSAIFRNFPDVHDSGVDMQVKVVNKYFVNSEGTVYRQPATLVSLMAYATTQAEDGTKLKHHVPFFAPGIAQLPDEEKLSAGIRKMAEELTALRKAPVLDEYIGPVLFTGQASAELFVQMLAPHFSGERPPLTENPRMAQMLPSSKLAQRLNRQVLPREISIVDDPTLSMFKEQSLIGFYKIDDQGVPAQPVKLVESGVLKNLLMSRRPRKEIANSNGHARAGESGSATVRTGNLFITTENGKPYAQLKKELIQMCDDQGIPFGLIVKTVDNPSISGVDRSVSSLFIRSDGNEKKLTSPVLLYKIHVKDGREELVRGVSLGELTVRHFKNISAVGSDCYVHHRLLTGGGSSFSSYYYIIGGDSSRGSGIPGTITAPSVLFEELEFKKDKGSRKNPPLLVHPFFR